MSKTVGVSFRPGGKVYLYDPEELPLAPGDEVIVPVTRGVGYGRVVTPVKQVADEGCDKRLKKVLRRASAGDKERQKENVKNKREAYRTARKLIHEHGLHMKLVDMEYGFDGASIVFYFTAGDRVDFRDLVRELTTTLNARIELRQVGVRDEAKRIGGLGPCGRDLCCSLFLSDFNPVSIKMAKEQNLSLNPSKISGVCGRLMCCLKYEAAAYEEFNRRAPSIGATVAVEDGTGRVVGYHVPMGLVVVEIEAGKRVNVSLKDFESRE
ncbi:MAG: stage 0 sporulation protein [Candidatus Anoxymicrobium japonicum]|uniref:Stage 0 sporulation protein n=1 Tax=Candidatus Anoxymicrobium japonicum TaxID=2013648 RepID=A0A2N3G4E7_9ACTN|nr:MAG: stage 0 sporulation protein [Candidatus Anoxymicrobium japonicum]